MGIIWILLSSLILFATVNALTINNKIILPFTKVGGGYVSSGSGFLLAVNEEGKVIYSVDGITFEEIFGKPESISPYDKALTKISVIKGKDPSLIKLGLPTFKKIKLKGIFPNVDLIFSLNKNTVEKIFVVRKGGNLEDLKVKVEGVVKLSVERDGSLILRKKEGILRFTKPIAYQYIDGERRYVDVSYGIGKDYYYFKVGNYDKDYDLFIDPLISGTFLGGSRDDVIWSKKSILTDSSGNVYIIGSTNSWDFPTNGLSFPDATNGDAFIIKLDPSLQNILAVVFIGGSGMDTGVSMVIDPSGFITAVISSISADAYTSNGAYQPNSAGYYDLYIIKINKDLSTPPVYATYFGGSNGDFPASIAVDSGGNVYVVGRTNSPDMPTLVNSYDKVCDEGSGCEDGFIAKLNNDLTQLLGFTYLGSVGGDNANDVAIDSVGNVYVVGSTGSANSCDFPSPNISTTGPCGFVVKLDSSLSNILRGIITGNQWEIASTVKVLPTGDILVGGTTQKPTSSCYYDPLTNTLVCKDEIFIRKYDNQLNLLGEIFITGKGDDNLNDISVDSAGNIYAVGSTEAPDMPTHSTAFQTEKVSFEAGMFDGFVAKISSDLSSVLALTYIGGCLSDEVKSLSLVNGDVYIVGNTNSPNFPVTSGVLQDTYSGCTYDSRNGRWTCLGETFVLRLTSELSYGTDPRIAVSLCVYDFGTANVGDSSYPKEIRIYNFGGSNLTINSISFTDGTHFSLNLNGGANPCTQLPKTLSPGSFCSFEVTFTPQSNGDISTQLVIQSNDPLNGNYTIELTGEGIGPEIYVYPNPIDFKSVAVGSTSSLLVTVRNNGSLNLLINSVQLSGDSVFSISNDNCSNKTLQPLSSCSLTVNFSPTALQNYQASLIINSNDPSSPTSVPVMGTGATNEPNIVINPTFHDFGNVFIGANKVFSSFTVENTGLVDLNITNIYITGSADFRINYTTCTNAVLGPNQTCFIDVVFSPSSAGSKTGTLNIDSNDPDTPTLTANLTGNGVLPPDIDVNPLSIDFGNVNVGGSATRTLTISNLGSSDLEILYVGGLTLPLSISPGQTNPCPSTSSVPFTLAPSQSCTYDITFSPSQAGQVNVQLTINSNDPDENPLYINIVGVGISSDNPLISVDPASIDFGVQGIGTRSQSSRITVSNIGGQPLSVNSATLTDTNNFIITLDNCSGNQLQSGDICYIDVAFEPSQMGIINASLIIDSNDPANPSFSISLSGEGIPKDPTISVEPASFDFGDVSLGYPRRTTFSISNAGYDVLSISSVKITGANQAEFQILRDNCTNNVLSYGSICTVDVEFNPSSVGQGKSAVLEIYSNDPANNPAKVNLYGNAVPPPVIIVDPNIIDFGEVLLNTQKQVLVKVRNGGSREVTINEVSLSSTNMGEFDVASTCTTLRPDEFCNVTVSFMPITKGLKTAYLVISYAGDQIFRVQIIGYGITQEDLNIIEEKPPSIKTEKVLSFGKVKVNSYKEKILYVKNEGDKPAKVLYFSLRDGRPGEFRVMEDKCSGRILKGGESCYFRVGIFPSVQGKIRTNFDIYWLEAEIGSKIGPPYDHKVHTVILEGDGEVDLFGCYSFSGSYIFVLLIILRLIRNHFLTSMKRKREREV